VSLPLSHDPKSGPKASQAQGGDDTVKARLIRTDQVAAGTAGFTFKLEDRFTFEIRTEEYSGC
jgi:hypothetical protein